MEDNKEKIKFFFIRNKGKILFVGGCVALITASFLKKENYDLKKRITKMSKERIVDKNKVKVMQNKIKALQKELFDQDAYMKSFFSQGTRDGYSECAKQLVKRRWSS